MITNKFNIRGQTVKHYIGIDVSKARLDVDWLGNPKAYNNEGKDLKKLVSALILLKESKQLSLVICEATGGYEQKIVKACNEAEISVHDAHANKVRHFAKSQGLLAKTDSIDVVVLTDYGRLLKPGADMFHLNETTGKIAEKLRRREQLQADRKRDRKEIYSRRPL